MKNAIYIAAIVSFAATGAYAQADSGGSGVMARGGGMAKTTMIYLDASDDTPESKAVGRATRLEMERSRQLEPVYIDDNQRARLIAPVTLTKDAAGDKMTVAIEMRTARKLVETAEITCPVAKPATCGRDIVAAAEKFIRTNKNR